MNCGVSDRVRIGTCSGLADAALVRSVLSAHGYHVVVGAEHHAGVLTGLGGGFVSLDIWVDEDEAEDAAALLHDLRSGNAEVPEDGADEADDHAGEPDGAGDGEAGDGDHETDDDAGDGDHGGAMARAASSAGAPTSLGDSVEMRVDRRRRTAVALLLGCLVTFGTAHMFTRAWLRGVALAGIEILGFAWVGGGRPIGGLLVAAAVTWDIVGAVWRIRASLPVGPSPKLPAARIHHD